MVMGGCYVNPQGRIIESSLGKGTFSLTIISIDNYAPIVVLVFVGTLLILVETDFCSSIYILLHLLHHV